MVQELARKTAKKMENQGVIASKTIPIYAYGLELLYSSLAGVVALIIISAILGKPFLWIPYLAGFVPLRLSGGGYHAKTHFRCIFTFSLLYSLVLVIEIMCTVPMKAWLFPCLTNLIIILLFSPVEAPNKPLKENQCRKNRCNSLILGLTKENQMKHQKNTHSLKIIACMLCLVMVATLLPVAAFASGSCSYRFSTGVICGKYITHRTSDTSATKQAVHYYYDPNTGSNTARCDYSYYTVTEADVCAAGHTTNKTTTRHEFNHACQYPGK